MNKQSKILVLEEFREINELKKKAMKRYEELKKQILSEIEAGKYGDFVLDFEERQVKDYVVAARVDTIIKVIKIGEK